MSQAMSVTGLNKIMLEMGLVNDAFSSIATHKTEEGVQHKISNFLVNAEYILAEIGFLLFVTRPVNFERVGELSGKLIKICQGMGVEKLRLAVIQLQEEATRQQSEDCGLLWERAHAAYDVLEHNLQDYVELHTGVKCELTSLLQRCHKESAGSFFAAIASNRVFAATEGRERAVQAAIEEAKANLRRKEAEQEETAKLAHEIEAKQATEILEINNQLAKVEIELAAAKEVYEQAVGSSGLWFQESWFQERAAGGGGTSRRERGSSSSK